jgi:superfamily II DNA or RNA helicase
MQPELSRTLTSYQAQFVQAFLASGSPKHQWLSAPTGTGRSQCAISIIAGVREIKSEARILLLAPRTFLVQWFRRLDSLIDTDLLLEGNRRNPARYLKAAAAPILP